MESIKQWFQDWSDACEYAKECVPDISFLVPPEPFFALGSIGAVCFAVWGWNESEVKQLRPRTQQMTDMIQATQSDDLKAQSVAEPAKT